MAVNGKYHVQLHKTDTTTGAVDAVYPINKDEDVLVTPTNNVPSNATTLTDVLASLSAQAFSESSASKESLGLGNVTNDAQVKGITSVNENDVVVWGSDGYTVKDSGFKLGTSVPEDAVFTDTTYGDASITEKGIVQLTDSYQSESTNTAATPNSVKVAYDLAKTKVSTITSGTNNGTISVDGSEVSVAGLKDAAYKDATDFATAEQGEKADGAMQTSGGTFTGEVLLSSDPTNALGVATKQYVDTSVEALMGAANAMTIKGTIGEETDSPTVTALPTTVQSGWTYKVITDGTYAGYDCVVGDILVALESGEDITADSTSWFYIPSGDIDVASTSVSYSTTSTNLTSTAQTGNIILGEAATKQVDYSITDTTSENLGTVKAIIEYLKGLGYGGTTSVTGVKGNNETTYRSGDVNITVENIGAATSEQGAKADTALQGITIGTVSTGESGTNADASVSTANSIASLNLVLPRGEKGDDGVGATVSVESTTTAEAGQSASVSNTGTDTDVKLNFVIPKGDKGLQGDKGETGDTLTPAVGTVTSVESTDDANVSVEVSGSTATFNFSIPKGERGATGVGQTGATGTRGTQIFSGTVITGTDTTGSIFSTGITSALVGDFYFNTETSDMYKCTTQGNESTATWVYVTNLKGNDGDEGKAGSDGTTYTPTIGTVTSVASDTDASASVAIDGTNAVFDFNIPKGTPGEAGSNGVTPDVTVGTVTTVDASESATVTNSGSGTNVILDFTIPRGSTGETGATGVRGSMWFNGTGITGDNALDTIFSDSGVTTAYVNDYYLNTSTGNIYICTKAGAATVATWSFVCSTRFPTVVSETEPDYACTWFKIVSED